MSKCGIKALRLVHGIEPQLLCRQIFNPDLPLISEHDGPFIPGVTFLYNRTSDDVLLVIMCPQSGTIATNSTLSLQPYTTSLLPTGPILNSYAVDAVYLGPKITMPAASKRGAGSDSMCRPSAAFWSSQPSFHAFFCPQACVP